MAVFQPFCKGNILPANHQPFGSGIEASLGLEDQGVLRLRFDPLTVE